MQNVLTLRNLIGAYFVVGALVCFIHPLLLRRHLRDLASAPLLLGTFGTVLKPLVKPTMGLVISLVCVTLWPVVWFYAGKAEKKAQAALDAKLERLRPQFELYSAMNAPVGYGGGDGLSFDQAIIIKDANCASGVRAEYDFMKRHYPGYELSRQLLKQQRGRSFDVFEFTTADGEKKTLYFDISDYLGTPH